MELMPSRCYTKMVYFSQTVKFMQQKSICEMQMLDFKSVAGERLELSTS